MQSMLRAGVWSAVLALAVACDPAPPEAPQLDERTGASEISPTVWHTNEDGEPTRFAPDAARALPDLQPSLRDRLARSELVFVGEAVSVEHAMARTQPGQRPVPHTFVTYRIDVPVSGGEVGEHVTLRFFGGPSADGGGTMASHIPRIDLGDRDLLFVAGNGERDCPVVDGDEGRLRVVDGALYSELGQPLRVVDGRIVLGAAVDLPQVRTHQVGQTRFTRGAPPIADAPAPGLPIASAELATRLGASGPGAHAVPSLDATVPFDLPSRR